MAERNFTLIELHLDDATVDTAELSSMLGDRFGDTGGMIESGDGMGAEEGAGGTDEGDSGSRLVRMLLLVVLFAAASAAAKKYRGEDELAELTDFDEEEQEQEEAEI